MGNPHFIKQEDVRPLPCCRCGSEERLWDVIADKAYCPQCQEAIATGQAEPLIEKTQAKRCVICDQEGSVSFHTYPLQATVPIQMDLCPEHLRGVVGRRLGPHAFHQLRRQLIQLHLRAEDIFLLHGAFYDPMGKALQPAVERLF